MVKATFYLDVERNIENFTLIDELKDAVVNNTLGQFEVDPGTFQAIHRIVGKFRYLRFTFQETDGLRPRAGGTVCSFI